MDVEVALLDLIKIIEKGEGPHLDFKEMIPRDLGKVIASFASCGGGLILIGINKNQQVIGVETKELDGLWQHVDEAIQKVHPTCHCDYINEEIQNRSIMVIKIRAGNHPLYYYNATPYIREGTSSRPASPEEVENMVLEFHFEQGLRAVLNELKTIKQIIDGQMFVLELPTDSWKQLILRTSSNGQDVILNEVNSIYQQILIWNSHAIVVRNLKNEEYSFNYPFKGLIGEFFDKRKSSLTITLDASIISLEDKLGLHTS